uniref:Uncharacterized protein n=1 Tax=Oxyrrhis marina TaxID=2969 RepID=A0A7S3XJT6_OXYMA
MSVCGVNSIDDRWGPRAALTAAPPQNFGYQGAPAAGRRNGGISGAPRREPSNDRGSAAAVRRFQAPACANVHAPTRRSPEGLAGPVPQGEVDISTVNAGFLRKPDQEMIMELYRDAFREENAAKEQKGLKTTNSMPAETAFGFIFARTLNSSCNQQKSEYSCDPRLGGWRRRQPPVLTNKGSSARGLPVATSDP